MWSSTHQQTMTGQSGARSEKKRVNESGALEEVGQGKRRNISGNIWKEGKRAKGLGSCTPDRFWSNSDILIKTCQHKCTQGVMQKLNISPRSSQNCLHDNTYTNKKVNLIKSSQSSMTRLWATLDERQSDEETTTTSTSHNNKHNAPQTHTHTATMVTEWNPPTSW